MAIVPPDPLPIGSERPVQGEKPFPQVLLLKLPALPVFYP